MDHAEKLAAAKVKYGREFPVNIAHGRVKPKSSFLKKLEKIVGQSERRAR